jgi:1-deoxy-D-xylulose-5-phosphate reductoisomerase
VCDLIILGSTGSIGTQALDVVCDNPDRFRVVGLGAGRNRELAEAQAAEFGVTNLAIGES